MAATSTVYLIHFDQKLAHAQHYLGSAVNVEARIAHHRHGSGAKILKAANEAGIDWSVVKTWKTRDGSGRQLERQLKNRKNAPKLCPVCTGEYGDVIPFS